ncbi:hypothetical protein Tsubulata_006242 [Turnera subulata]|uniref:N-acetyltransferase domain-containing protein n=1 Tax=Turnera subulata TaxID=218843 RepID=A0A9Q0FKE2_9ROSI|nr:hypothetical protein Tsubulata_006242 [Turnera subulata]
MPSFDRQVVPGGGRDLVGGPALGRRLPPRPLLLPIQSFHFRPPKREFEALKERVAGKRTGFKKVSCINATLPLSHLSSLLIPADDDEDAGFDLCTQCKFSDVGGEDRVVVGTLDLNQCLSLPDEITGSKPEVMLNFCLAFSCYVGILRLPVSFTQGVGTLEDAQASNSLVWQGIGADFARAYLSNVCVAKELHKNGLGYEVVGKAKVVAQGWGISDLYVHVAIDNEPAKRLYTKSGFVYEKDEPAWQARFLDRPRRLLLWIGLSSTLGL